MLQRLLRMPTHAMVCKMADPKLVRKRKPNFTEEEICVLLEEVMANKAVLLSTAIYGGTNTKKQEVYERIAEAVNSCTSITKRSPAEIREKWMGLKMSIMKKDRKEKLRQVKLPDVPFEETIRMILGKTSEGYSHLSATLGGLTTNTTIQQQNDSPSQLIVKSPPVHPTSTTVFLEISPGVAGTSSVEVDHETEGVKYFDNNLTKTTPCDKSSGLSKTSESTRDVTYFDSVSANQAPCGKSSGLSRTNEPTGDFTYFDSDSANPTPSDNSSGLSQMSQSSGSTQKGKKIFKRKRRFGHLAVDSYVPVTVEEKKHFAALLDSEIERNKAKAEKDKAKAELLRNQSKWGVYEMQKNRAQVELLKRQSLREMLEVQRLKQGLGIKEESRLDYEIYTNISNKDDNDRGSDDEMR